MGNEAANKLAKRGSETIIEAIKHNCVPILRKNLKPNRKTTKDAVKQKVQLRWYQNRPARDLIRLKSDDIRKAIDILTGHCFLNKHLGTIGALWAGDTWRQKKVHVACFHRTLKYQAEGRSTGSHPPINITPGNT